MTPAVERLAGDLLTGLIVSAIIGSLFTLLLLSKSLRDFTRTGPQMTDEVLSHYRLYLAYAIGRLAAYAFLIASAMAFLGVAIYLIGNLMFDARFRIVAAAIAGLVALGLLSARALARTLLLSPGVIASSAQFSMTRLVPLWRHLGPDRLCAADAALAGALAVWVSAGIATLARQQAWSALLLLAAVAGVYLAVIAWANRSREPAPVRHRHEHSQPNVLLIGSDTLRADRLNGAGYRRELAPHLEGLAKRGTQFTDCYVPCARTAPSIVSLLTGTWPHTHGVRDTFVTQEETRLPIAALPQLLKKSGYTSAIVGDWAAADAEKFTFGFDHMDLPEDQWNIKYLLRQGPKDLRLFLSLFTQNRFGKTLLPEIYYLGGIPLTEEVGRDTRRMLARLARQDEPFFVVSFMATTHPPFASKHPYYSMFSDVAYAGESKFTMAKLRDPFEIIRRQGEPRTEFDLDQIIDLYDGCVKSFDDELQRVLDYLDASGLAANTIVGVFSDHGMEFFEHETWGQGNSAIGDFSARVPFVIVDPRNPQQHVVSDVVRTVDIAPTLLDLLALPVPAYMEGVSLAPLMHGVPLAQELPAFYETGVWLTDLPGTPEGHLRYPHLPDLIEVPDKRLGMISLKPRYMDIIIAAKDRMVRVGEWKLTYQPLRDGALYRLFNIREDPGCQHDVVASHPEIADRLKRMLTCWIAADLRSAPAVNGDTAGGAEKSDHRGMTKQALS